MKYRFSITADQRQDDVWQYTLEKGSEEQAISYIRELHQHLSKLADNDLLWRAIKVNGFKLRITLPDLYLHI